MDPIIEQLIASFRRLPNVGYRSARRMAMGVCSQKQVSSQLAESLQQVTEKIAPCQRCRDYTSLQTCPLCQSTKRQHTIICVVAYSQDLYAIEQSGCYSGNYFVLHGLLSPIDNIGYEELGIDSYTELLNEATEVILALPSTVEGEVTASILTDIAKAKQLPVSRLAQGLPMGGEIGGMDNHTLSYALNQRKSI